jgi:CBS domain-containing protein
MTSLVTLRPELYWDSGFSKDGIAMANPKILDKRVSGKQGGFPQHPRVERLTVRSILQRRPSELHCISADAPSLEALKLMAEDDIGALPVMEGGRMIGIFSERDYARRSIQAMEQAAARPVREVMTRCAVSVTPADSAHQCLSLMIQNRLRYLPVQEAGKLIALLALDDLLLEIAAYLERVCKEGELDQQIAFLRGTYSC